MVNTMKNDPLVKTADYGNNSYYIIHSFHWEFVKFDL